MNSLQIEYFLELCKHMSFTETARILYVSQPAVSKQISSLEKEIGLTLFDRTYRGLRLTPSGEILRDAFASMGRIYTSALNEAKKCNAQNKGSLALGVSKGWHIAKFLSPELMGKMKVDYPNISFSIQNLGRDELYDRLRQNILDVIFVRQHTDSHDHENLASIVIKEVALRLFYPTAHFSGHTEITLEDLASEDFFIYDEDSSTETAAQLTALCKECGFLPHIINVPNIESAISSAEAGLGVVVLDELNKLSTNTLFRYIDLPIHRNICMVWRQADRNPLPALVVNELQLLLN